jgi:hypothetical protein
MKIRILPIIFAVSLFLSEPQAGLFDHFDEISLKGVSTRASTSQKDIIGAMMLGRNPDLQGRSFNLEIFPKKHCSWLDNRIKRLKKFRPFIDFSSTNFDDRKIQSIGIGFQKQFSFSKKDKHPLFKPYTSFGIGYGVLEWKIPPLNSVIQKDFKATSATGFLSFGLIYNLNKHLDLDISYRYDRYRFITDLEVTGSKSELHDKAGSAFRVGLRYRF